MHPRVARFRHSGVAARATGALAAVVLVLAAGAAVAIGRASPSGRPSTTGAPHTIVLAPDPWPVASLHGAVNGNLGTDGSYLPGADGFNLADISTVAELDALPAGVRALVWIGSCGGATSTFARTVVAFSRDPRVFAFYLMDEPYLSTCPARDLEAESNWVHHHVRGARTFVVLTNLGPARTPSYRGAYSPANTNVDLVGLDPYPVRSELTSPDYGEIAKRVGAAEAAGWPLASLVPVYQAFGGGAETDDGGGHWAAPTAVQERTMLAAWAAVLPNPVFDLVYSWGTQQGDVALQGLPTLRALFRDKNAARPS
jgi:hypothetical protein